MNRLLLPLAFLFAFCGTTKKVEEPINIAPAWVQNYPVIEGYYVGIGIADKSTHPEEFIQVAQQNALQNLSTQIKVNIATESVFLQMEREYGFEEEFKSNIKIKADEYIEGYEMAGTFTQKNEYWVYYRLNIEKHNEIQEARKFEAMELSKSYLNEANDSYNKPQERYINFVSALSILKPYLSDPLYTEYDRKNVFLGNEIISSFRSFVDDFRMKYVGKKIKVMIGDEVGDIKIQVNHNQQPLKNVKLNISSSIMQVEKFSETTDENGIFTVIVPKITSAEAIQKMFVSINFEDWINESTSDEFIKKLIESIQTHQINIPAYVYTPNIYVVSQEKHFNKEKVSTELKFAAESALNKLGFTAVSNKKDADLFMSIFSNTEKGQVINGQKMFTAYLNLTIQVKDNNDLIVFSDQVNKIKGIQLDIESANSDAYKGAKEEIENTVIPNFVNSFVK
ncbi:MAG: LPP20 family lipoprotein [Flavobacteriales bacterium]